jgi:hypothetical protein
LIQTDSFADSGTGVIDLAGGPSGENTAGAGAAGVFMVGTLGVAEPSSILLLATALPVVAICFWRRVVSQHVLSREVISPSGMTSTPAAYTPR